MHEANAANRPDTEAIIHVHRSPRSVILQLSLATIIGFLGLAFWNEPLLFSSPIKWLGVEIHLPLFLLLFLFLALRPVFLLKDCRHELTPHHIKSISGLLSLHRREVNIPYEDLRGVRADQSIFERFLGVGTVVTWTHSGSSPEVRLMGIRHPRDVVAIISDRIDRAILRRSSGGTTGH